MADNRPILNVLEWVDRRERVTTTGTEIVSTIYCEPASSGPMVVAALLGRVTGNELSSKRVMPVYDPIYPYCYCVEANRRPLDARAVANSESITPSKNFYDPDPLKAVHEAFLTPPFFDGPVSMASDGKYKQPDDTRGECGCYIEAVFRPLLSAYNGSEEQATTGSFDYVDPQFFTCYRTFNNANALYALPDINPNHWLTKNYKIGEETQFTETWQEFTIRRIMCPTVPWETINKLSNTINLYTWQPLWFDLPTLPIFGKPPVQGFPPGTLRFDGCSPNKRVTPTVLKDDNDPLSFLLDAHGNPFCAANTSWDMTYKFSWRTIWNWWIDFEGNIQEPKWLTWNMQFGGPFGKLLASPAAWYDTFAWSFFTGTSSITDPDNNVFGAKYRFAEDIGVNSPTGRPFDALFYLNSP